MRFKKLTENKEIKNQKDLVKQMDLSVKDAEEAAKEEHDKNVKVFKDTLDSLKEGFNYTINVKNRANLAKLVESLKEKNIKHRITRSKTEGFKYDVMFKYNLKESNNCTFKFEVHAVDDKDEDKVYKEFTSESKATEYAKNCGVKCFIDKVTYCDGEFTNSDTIYGPADLVESKLKENYNKDNLDEGIYKNGTKFIQIKMLGRNDVLVDKFDYSKEYGKDYAFKNRRFDYDSILHILNNGYTKVNSYKEDINKGNNAPITDEDQMKEWEYEDENNWNESCKGKRLTESDLVNIKELEKATFIDKKDNKKHTLSLLQCDFDGSNYDFPTYATVNDYNGEKRWNKGALISVSLDGAYRDYLGQLKLYDKDNEVVKKIEGKKQAEKQAKIDALPNKMKQLLNDLQKGLEEYAYNPDWSSFNTYDYTSEEEIEYWKKNIKDNPVTPEEEAEVDEWEKEFDEEFAKSFLKHSGVSIERYDRKADPDYSYRDTGFNGYQVNVWAELDYEEMDSLVDRLNPILQKYDDDAYFEHETSGRVVAYITDDKVNESLKESAEDKTIVKVYRLITEDGDYQGYGESQRYFYNAGDLMAQYDSTNDWDFPEGYGDTVEDAINYFKKEYKWGPYGIKVNNEWIQPIPYRAFGFDENGNKLEECGKSNFKGYYESLKLNESSDGWELEDTDGYDVLDDIEALKYEIDNCIKGAYTKCKTYRQLGHYIKDLANNLDYFGDTVSFVEEDFDESCKKEKLLTEDPTQDRIDELKQISRQRPLTDDEVKELAGLSKRKNESLKEDIDEEDIRGGKLKDALTSVGDGFDITDTIFDWGEYLEYPYEDLYSSDAYSKVMKLLADNIDFVEYREDGYSPCKVAEFIEKNIDKFNQFLNVVYNEEFKPQNFEKQYTVNDEEFYDIYMDMMSELIRGDFEDEDYQLLLDIFNGKKVTNENLTEKKKQPKARWNANPEASAEFISKGTSFNQNLAGQPCCEDYDNEDEDNYCEKRIKQLKQIKKQRPLTDQEEDELNACISNIDSEDAERKYLNGESLNEKKETIMVMVYYTDSIERYYVSSMEEAKKLANKYKNDKSVVAIECGTVKDKKQKEFNGKTTELYHINNPKNESLKESDEEDEVIKDESEEIEIDDLDDINIDEFDDIDLDNISLNDIVDEDEQALEVIKDKLDMHGELAKDGKKELITVAEKGKLDDKKAPKITFEADEEETEILAKQFCDDCQDEEEVQASSDSDDDNIDFDEIVDAEKVDAKKAVSDLKGMSVDGNKEEKDIPTEDEVVDIEEEDDDTSFLDKLA